MVEDRTGKDRGFVGNIIVLARALVERRLFVSDSYQSREDRLTVQRRCNETWFKARIPLSELQKDVARFHYLKPVPLLPGLLSIVPVWRKNKEVPELPYQGRSGKVYKPGQDIPVYEGY